MFALITTYAPRLWAIVRAGFFLVADGVTIVVEFIVAGAQDAYDLVTAKPAKPAKPAKHPHPTSETPPAPLQTPIEASSEQHSASASALFTHVRHWHTPRNVNEQHAAEQTDLNSRIAVWLTSHVGTMWTAYLFAVLATVTIFAVLGLFGVLSPLLAAVGAAVSQTFIQLVLLPVIMVGQNVLNRHAELAADEAYANIVRLLHEQEQHRQHLDAQDAELLAHRAMLATLQTHTATPTDAILSDTTLLEDLATLAHSSWAHYMAYFFSKLQRRTDGRLIVSAAYAKNLQRLIDTPYAALSDDERGEDRDEAQGYLAVLRRHMTPQAMPAAPYTASASPDVATAPPATPATPATPAKRATKKAAQKVTADAST